VTRYILYDLEAEDIGVFDRDALWPGEVIELEDGRRFRIVNAISRDRLTEFVDDPQVGALVVEPVDIRCSCCPPPSKWPNSTRERAVRTF
jgi:hypothetical protein